MNRIRIATITSSFLLTIYFLIAGIAAMLIGPSAFVSRSMLPISLLEDLFSVAFVRSSFGCDLLAVFSLWLTFVCMIDLSLLLSSIDIRHSVRSFTANNYAKRLLPRFRAI
jgi:hypothetical protein